MERETRLAVGWVAAVVIGITGAFVVEATNPGLQPFEVRWPVEREGSLLAQGVLATGEIYRFPFGIHLPNVTAVHVAVTWADDVGDPDTFEVTIVDRHNVSSAPAGSDQGTLETQVPVGAVPSASTVRASDQEALRRGAGESFERPIEPGVWEVRVTLVDAPGVRLADSGIELQPDGSNAFDLEVTFDVYRLQVA